MDARAPGGPEVAKIGPLDVEAGAEAITGVPGGPTVLAHRGGPEGEEGVVAPVLVQAPPPAQEAPAHTAVAGPVPALAGPTMVKGRDPIGPVARPVATRIEVPRPGAYLPDGDPGERARRIP